MKTKACRFGAAVLLLGLNWNLAYSQTAAPAPAAAAPVAQTVRIRGSIVAVAADKLTVRDRSGEMVDLRLSPKLAIVEVYPIELKSIASGSFIGTAAMPQADGTLKAIAITVFPETMRGVGEGHRAFDLLPQSTMTNATVAQVVGDASGRTLKLQFPGGEKTVLVDPAVPIVSFKPGDQSLLVPGASVSIGAQLVDNVPTAMRINAGRGGFVIPY
jgi:hypothetical protein